jgi:hypothetical protein
VLHILLPIEKLSVWLLRSVEKLRWGTRVPNVLATSIDGRLLFEVSPRPSEVSVNTTKVSAGMTEVSAGTVRAYELVREYEV